METLAWKASCPRCGRDTLRFIGDADVKPCYACRDDNPKAVKRRK